MITWIALFLLELTAAGYCRNGAGGKFPCRFAMSNKEIALEACKSVYGSCKKGSCGNFHYYYSSSHMSCNCDKRLGTYEFIFKNTGYSYVGHDYRGGVGAGVTGNHLFVRIKTSRKCNNLPWSLSLANLGEDIPTPTASPTEKPSNKPTENPTDIPTENPTNRPTFRPSAAPSRIPCKDQFPWCGYPNICDNDDVRQKCPFSCDDCLTAGPTTMPTASPTEDCAAREDMLEGVIDHMWNHYLKDEEDEEGSGSSE